MDERLNTFVAALERRHLSQLTFQEVRRALTALSSVYVERRDKLHRGAALDGAGKRAAFALFYGPMHLAVIDAIAQELAPARVPGTVVDLGCGTGVGGAAFAGAIGARRVLGIDVNRWAADEARFTYGHFGLEAEVRVGDLTKARFSDAAAIVVAYTVNELDERARDTLLARLGEAARTGSSVLVIEPIAKRDRPWWPAWEHAFTALGGSAREWRLQLDMPERWRLLDRAAGLSHTEHKARTLYIPSRR